MRTFDRNLLADLNVFLTIARRGSMTKAGNELGVSASALSHRLRKLESGMNVRLLNRTSRSLKMTAAGAELARQLEEGFRTIDEALTGLENHRQLPVGDLRLNMLRDAARLVLAPIMPQYARTYPQMHVDMTVDDRIVDIIEGGFDAGIRYGDRVPLDMVGLALTKPQSWVVAASPALIDRVGIPDSPQDLLRRPCIETRVGDGSRFPWELGNADKQTRLDVRGPLCTNETEQAVDAAVRGIGFAYCLERRIEPEIASGTLRVVLPEWASEGPPFTIYYASRRQVPPGLRQLIDMVRSAEGLSPMAESGVFPDSDTR